MKVHDIKKLVEDKLLHFFSPNEVQSLTHLLLLHYAKLSRVESILQKDSELPQSIVEQILEAVVRLQNFEPIQYILGETDFYGLPFIVNSAVLIPRPETEELVDMVIKTCKTENRHLKIIDICTGSGCIAVSLAHFLPKSSVFAFDISDEALIVAKKNALKNNTEVSYSQTDIFNLPDNFLSEYQFDIIVSNPPYVRNSEKKLMHNNVLLHEPQIALFVDDNEPLIFYKAIADFAILKLKSSGKIFLEINEFLGFDTQKLFQNIGFVNVELLNDINGKTRILTAQKF